MEQLRDAATLPRPRPAQALQSLSRVIERVATAFALPPAALTSGTRARRVAQARAAVSAVAVPPLGSRPPGAPPPSGSRKCRCSALSAIGRGLLAARGLDPERLAREVMR